MNTLRCALALFLLGCGGGQQAPGAAHDTPDPTDPPGKGGLAADSPTTDPPAPPATDGAPSDPPPGVDGGTLAPATVSFSAQIVPLFDRLACAACHSGNGPGRDLGNLTLDGGSNLIYREVALELSPNFHTPRVDLKHPEQSLILTMPGAEPDNHPVVVFTSTASPDYQLLLTWIQEGARQN
jgi:hypothetical protein